MLGAGVPSPILIGNMHKKILPMTCVGLLAIKPIANNPIKLQAIFEGYNAFPAVADNCVKSQSF